MFKTGSSEAATEKGRLDSSGRLNVGQTSAYAPTGGGVSMATFEEGSDSRTNLVVSNQNSGSSAGSAIALAVHGADYIIEAQGSGKGGGLTFTKSDSVRMTIDANGHVTMPLQSAFFAHADTAQSNIATSTNVDVTFGTERFDQNGDFASSVFTAPVTGKYQFNVNVRLNTVDQAAGYYICYLVTSNKNYFTIYDPGQFAGDPDFWTQSLSVVADMDASDTAKVRLLQNGGTAQSDVDGGPSDTPSNFSGYLVA